MIDLRLGDCLDVMAAMEPNSVDTVITDPPYGLAFMGKDWDHGVPGAHFWQEVLRVCKPGAMLLAFGGTRTFHRLTCAIEDAGWEIRDVMMWLYGSGFPKSHNLAVAFDKQNGMPHRGIGFTTAGYTPSATVPGGAHGPHSPSSDMGKVWQGYGTALKPAWEPIILAMKPLDGTFAQNAERWGVAGLNIEGGRIGTESGLQRPQRNGKGVSGGWAGYSQPTGMYGTQDGSGRWPANLILDEDAAKALDEQSGETGTGKRTERMTPANRAGTYSGFEMCSGAVNAPNTYPDTGGASRFFYVAKASRAEREAGLDVSLSWLDSIELIWDNNSTSTLTEVLLWGSQGQNQSTVWSGEVSRVRGISGDTRQEQDGNVLPMSSNGNGTTGLYLMAIRFTTSTGTRQTIESTILNSLTPSRTSGSTEDAIRTLRAYGLNPAESVAFTNLLKQISTGGGMVFPRGASNAARKTQPSTSARDVMLQGARGNIHSTVKPVTLMRYLCKLTATPTGGVVLDPFMGSGTTGIAAIYEGRSFIGIEKEAEYLDIARRRIAYAEQRAGLKMQNELLPEWAGEPTELIP